MNNHNDFDQRKSEMIRDRLVKTLKLFENIAWWHEKLNSFSACRILQGGHPSRYGWKAQSAVSNQQCNIYCNEYRPTVTGFCRDGACVCIYWC